MALSVSNKKCFGWYDNNKLLNKFGYRTPPWPTHQRRDVNCRRIITVFWYIRKIYNHWYSIWFPLRLRRRESFMMTVGFEFDWVVERNNSKAVIAWELLFNVLRKRRYRNILIRPYIILQTKEYGRWVILKLKINRLMSFRVLCNVFTSWSIFMRFKAFSLSHFTVKYLNEAFTHSYRNRCRASLIKHIICVYTPSGKDSK